MMFISISQSHNYLHGNMNTNVKYDCILFLHFYFFFICVTCSVFLQNQTTHHTAKSNSNDRWCERCEAWGVQEITGRRCVPALSVYRSTANTGNDNLVYLSLRLSRLGRNLNGGHCSFLWHSKGQILQHYRRSLPSPCLSYS